jgi:CheY-like chemotaxis protein
VLSTILLVEDEPSILALMSVILEPSGHTLLKATAVEQALQQFDHAATTIDLVIADVNLPGTSGIRIALELRSMLPNLRIVLTSGYPPDLWNQNDFLELNRLPSDSMAVLQKPFLPATLLQVVSRFVTVPMEPEMTFAKAAAS